MVPNWKSVFTKLLWGHTYIECPFHIPAGGPLPLMTPHLDPPVAVRQNTAGTRLTPWTVFRVVRDQRFGIAKKVALTIGGCAVTVSGRHQGEVI